MPLPPLRGTVRIQPFKHEGRDAFLAVDSQEQLFDHSIVLPPLTFVVASLLDGRRELEDVRREIKAQLGVDVPDEPLRGAVEDLDKHLLLETDPVRERRKAVERDYLAKAERPARFVAGAADEVRKEIDVYYAAEAGSGAPSGRRDEALPGILAPHIDFRRGGTCYTHAYREVAERSDADLYVILGVAHLSPPNPLIASSKDYETPLGRVPVDREALSILAKRFGPRLHEHESVHRSEHSAEFQAAFLRHARPGAAFTALPLLCSTFEPWCGDASPSTAAEIEDVLQALREAIQGRRACIVAGVDFAHIGPVFGDPKPLDQDRVAWMMAGDTRSLQTCSEGNAEAFWNSVVSDGNARNVCGLSATYSALRLLGDVEGKLHKYGFAPDPAGGLVSFASMSFRPKPRIVRA